MALTITHLSLFALSLAFIFCTSTEAFTVDLIRWDSPKSPFYNPAETRLDRLTRSLERSVSRANLFSLTIAGSTASVSDRKSQIIPNGGEYLLNISLGTPPVEIVAIPDTGSDLTWTQCSPCRGCYRQRDPLFNPRRSSTYKALSCEDDTCSALQGSATTSCDGRNVCQYSIGYGDRSYSKGVIAQDTVAFGTSAGKPVELPQTVFGCGFENAGTFSANGSGIVGMGGGPASTIVQAKTLIGGKFSYCLVPTSQPEASSKLNFGPDATVSGSGTVSTPLVAKNPSTFYYLTLESITVGNKNVAFSKKSVKGVGDDDGSGTAPAAAEEGNIIIDSGTTLTLLPQDFYLDLESAVSEAVNLEKVNSPVGGLGVCYKAPGEFDAPTITAHFTGADVVLNPINSFLRVSDEVVCLAFVPSQDLAIFGNVAQANFLVGYDLNQRTVSFKPADCSKL